MRAGQTLDNDLQVFVKIICQQNLKFYQLNLRAQTGKPHPNISTTFIGRSRPLEEAWRQIPRSAAPVKGNYSFNYNTEQDFWLKYMSFSKHITCKNKSLCKKCYVHVGL